MQSTGRAECICFTCNVEAPSTSVWVRTSFDEPTGRGETRQDIRYRYRPLPSTRTRQENAATYTTTRRIVHARGKIIFYMIGGSGTAPPCLLRSCCSLWQRTSRYDLGNRSSTGKDRTYCSFSRLLFSNCLRSLLLCNASAPKMRRKV